MTEVTDCYVDRTWISIMMVACRYEFYVRVLKTIFMKKANTITAYTWALGPGKSHIHHTYKQQTTLGKEISGKYEDVNIRILYCSEKRKVAREWSSRATVRLKEQIMSKYNYPCIYLKPKVVYCLYYPSNICSYTESSSTKQNRTNVEAKHVDYLVFLALLIRQTVYGVYGLDYMYVAW